MARRLGAAVNRIMLRCGNGAVVARIVTLQAGDVGDRHTACEVRVLAVGLLTTAPAWIAEDVDVRRPEIEAFERGRVSLLHRLSVLDAPLDTDGFRHLV